jgi:co-chaperonin GroES (HSP10)
MDKKTENGIFPYEATANNVCIKPKKQPEMTDSGIIIPQNIQQDYHSGIIVTVGPGLPGEPSALWPGADVVFTPNVGFPFEHGGEVYYIMLEHDIRLVNPSSFPRPKGEA